MKILLRNFLFQFILGVSFLNTPILAQNISINNNGNAPDPSAILDISSTSKGLLIPRMNTAERTAIAAPAQGLMVFDTDSRTFWFYSNGWNEITTGNGGGGLTLPYHGIGSDPDKLFSITNSSPGSSTAIYGKRLNGSGLGLSMSNAIWGDNADGHGVAGTSDTQAGVGGFSNSGAGVSAISISGPALSAISTTGLGISGTSQTNYAISALSNGVDKAGVLGINGNNTGIGYGVVGYIQHPTGGAAVWGHNAAQAGSAGLFTNTHSGNIDPALKVSTTGNGAAGYFTSYGLGPSGYFVHGNANNLNPGLLVSNSSAGVGLVVWNSPTSNNSAIQVIHNGMGKGIHSTSNLGISGLFDITNAANNSAALKATTAGTASAAWFEITNNTSPGSTMIASTTGKGKAGFFYKNNTTGSISDIIDPCVRIENISKGNALQITSLHSPSVESAIDVEYGGDAFGISVASTKGGILANSTGNNSTALIAQNYSGGQAVKAFTNSSLAAIQVENSHMFGIGIKAVTTGSESTAIQGISDSQASAVAGINTHGGGVGIMGRTDTSIGEIGYGVRGETSGNSWGVAGQFISNCPDATTNTVWILDNSKGQSLRIQVNNTENNNEAFYIRHDGTGKLASLNNANDEMFSVLNNGNTKAAGTLTVKGNKGIVRSSTSTQMRVENVTSPIVAHAGLGVGGFVTVNVNFSTAFSSAPTVSVANISSGFTGACDSMVAIVKDVTTTGCTLKVFNPYMPNSGPFSGTWKLQVLGAE